jgi:hypothetical protein
MLQKIFGIYPDNVHDVEFFAEAGKNYIALWCKQKDVNKLCAFEFFLCDDDLINNLEYNLQQVKQQSRLLTLNALNNNFYWNTNEVLCLPSPFSNETFLEANLNLMFGNNNGRQVFSSNADSYTVAWRIEKDAGTIVEKTVGSTVFNHPYTTFLSTLPGSDANAVYLFFYPYHFTFILFKDGKLQLAQTRKYTVPEDVLYFILNACKQYEINNSIQVLCGGFIEEQSKLFETLYQYLEGFTLINPGDTLFSGDGFKAYPSHYFAPYINYGL